MVATKPIEFNQKIDTFPFIHDDEFCLQDKDFNE